MQEDYNEMIESVKTNGGFYVGRYEMKIDSDTHSAVSSNNGSAVTAENCYGWHGLYAYGKTYENTKKTTETSVKSSMIWGSQYDAMLNYVLTGSDKDKVTSKENGKAVLINVTDLVSSYEEWTLEGNSDNGRSIRGGWNSHDKSPSYREWSSASEFSSWTSSRITLYING